MYYKLPTLSKVARLQARVCDLNLFLLVFFYLLQIARYLQLAE